MKGYVPKKSFGQNFLQDASVLERIAGAIASLRENDQTLVFEIGAGLGALTEALLKTGSRIQTIERDRDLIPILREKFHQAIQSGQLELHEANALTFFSLSSQPHPLTPSPATGEGELTQSPSPPSGEGFRVRFVICGNLPYHLSSSIFFETAKLYDKISGAVFLIQKEVADRIISHPHSKTYGLFSVLLQSRFEVSILENVSRKAFWPSPQVESSLIQLVPKNKQPIDWEKFVKLVKTAFSKRRKMLSNSLAEYDQIETILTQLKINQKCRAEDLSVEDYERIVACL